MKKHIFSKILAIALVVAMIMSLSLTSVFADYDQIEKEEGGVIYSEDFSDETVYPAMNPITVRNGDDWVDEKQVGNSDWYITKAPAGDPLNTPLGVGIDRNPEVVEDRKYGMRLSGELTSLDQHYFRRGTVIYRGDISELTNTYQITYKIDKSALAESSFKFGGTDSSSCYRFAMTGVNEESSTGNPVWALDRIVSNNRVERLLESDTIYRKSVGVMDTTVEPAVYTENGAMHEYTTVKITVIDNSSITVSVDGHVYNAVEFKETKKVNLSEPIPVNANESIYGFGGGYNTTNLIHYFELANYADVGEADNGIYANVAKKVDSDGVMELGEAFQISSIVNLGAESTTVLLSEDGETYKKLAEVDGQTKYVNDITGKKFKYVKLVGGKDVAIYSPLTYLKVAKTAYPLKARIDGIDVENAIFTSSDEKVAIVVDDTVVPFRSGKATITANDILNVNVRVDAAISKSTNFAAISEFVDGETSEVLNADNGETGIAVNDDWSFEFMDEGKYYPATYHSWPKIVASSGGLMLYNHPLSRNLTHAPMLTLKNLPAELGKNFKMTMNVNKNSVTCGLGLRFMVHNDGKNFYLLHLSGNTEEDGYIYVFEKYIDGECVGSVEGPAYDSSMSYDGRFGTGAIPMEITYEDGIISWTFTAKRQGGNNETYSNTFFDYEPFSVNIEDTTLGFVLNAPGIDSEGIGIRYSVITSFSIDSMNSPLATFCKDGICGLSLDADFYGPDIKAYIAEYDTSGKLVGIGSKTESVVYKMKAKDNKIKVFSFSGHDTLKPIIDNFDLN